MKTRFRFHYQTTAHLWLASLPLLSPPPCFALSPPGWLLHQPRQELIPEFCPWLSNPSLPGQWPASAALLWDLPAAVITSGTQALGLPHRWHGGGGGGCRGLKGREGRFFCAGRCKKCRWCACYSRIKLYSLPLVPPFKKATLLTLTKFIVWLYIVRCHNSIYFQSSKVPYLITYS